MSPNRRMPSKAIRSTAAMSSSKNPKKIRLDALLVQRGYFADADLAARACFAGEVTSNDVHVTAPSQMVPADIDLRVRAARRYVSRGGIKLAGALESSGLDVTGMSCVDVGTSSGGFADCLLQAGAATVSAVDVGYGQFDSRLRDDPRISLYERTNIKDVTAQQIGGPFDLLVADLSFISLGSLLPDFRELVRPSGYILVLVKPQFEIERGMIEDGGVVRDEADHRRVLEKMLDEVCESGFLPLNLACSPIRGEKRGNIEFFIFAGPSPQPDDSRSPSRHNDWRDKIDVEEIVHRAHIEL